MCIPSEARGSFKERTVFKRIVLQIFLFLVMAPSSSEPSIQGATLFACVAAPTKLADITIPSNLPAFLVHLACGSLQRQTVFKRIDRQIFLFLVMAPSNSEPSIQGASLFACVAASTKGADITLPCNVPLSWIQSCTWVTSTAYIFKTYRPTDLPAPGQSM